MNRFLKIFISMVGLVVFIGLLIVLAPPAVKARLDPAQLIVHIPLVFSKPATSPASPIVLVSGQANPVSLVVDSQWVYWSNCGTDMAAPTDGAILAYSKSQANIISLAPGRSCPNFLSADANALFWVERRWVSGQGEFTVFRLPKKGGQPELLATYLAMNGSLALDETYVYWRETSEQVMRLPKTGGSPQPAPVPSLVFDGPDAYWLNSENDLICSDKDGNSTVTLVKGSDLEQLAGREPSAVTIRDIYPRSSDIFFTVYVDNYPGMLSCTDQSTILMKLPKSGGEYVQITRVPGRVLFFIAEPFYYFSGDCTPGVTKADLSHEGEIATWSGSAKAFADDEASVYWADTTQGEIMAIGK